jgi:hypothetical protein
MFSALCTQQPHEPACFQSALLSLLLLLLLPAGAGVL